MKMEIKTTFGEILDKDCWDKFCELKGYNVWSINEGLVDRTDEVILSFEEAHHIGLLDYWNKHFNNRRI